MKPVLRTGSHALTYKDWVIIGELICSKHISTNQDT